MEPYPKNLNIEYNGHKKPVSSISCNSTGSHLVTSSVDGSVRLWEAATARCIELLWLVDYTLEKSVSDSPAKKVNMVKWAPRSSLDCLTHNWIAAMRYCLSFLFYFL